jgi:hypothetical protein
LYSTIVFAFGSITPIAGVAPASVNQIAPFVSATMKRGTLSGRRPPFCGYVIFPVARS